MEKPRGKRVYKLSPLLAKELNLEEEVITIPSKEEKDFLAKIENILLAQKEETAKKFIDSIETTLSTVEQGSLEWVMLRVGKITGTRNPFTTKGLLAPSWGKLARQIAIEEFYSSTGLEEIEETDLNGQFKSYMMSRGNELEAVALNEYFALNPHLGRLDSGFIFSPEWGLGISLDSQAINIETFKKKNLEVKCPNLNNYLSALEGEYIKNYIVQINMQMLIAKVEETDFIVYYPNFKLHVEEVKLNREFKANFPDSLRIFREEANKYLTLLKENYKK
jgi:hypothetical protein